MNKIYKIFFIMVALLVTMFGCAKSESEQLPSDASSETSGTFRVGASTTNSQGATKVNVDGTTVTWGEGDEIALAEVGNSGEFVAYKIYKIDETSISDDGKYAEFYGADLEADKKYIAYNYPAGGTIISDNTADIPNGFDCKYNYETISTDGLDLIMQSSPFTFDGAEKPEISFTHQSALLELTIELAAGSDYAGTINNLEISSSNGEKLFLSSVVFDTEGNIINTNSQTNYGCESTISIATDAKISATEKAVIKLPLTWNSAITNPASDFVFKIATKDLRESSVVKALKPIENGNRYTGTITIDKPTQIAIPNNEIWYTTSDGKIVDLTPSTEFNDGFNANVISNSYENGRGIIELDAPLTAINEYTFFGRKNLATMILPEGLKTIGQSAFHNSSLNSISLPASIEFINFYAFAECEEMKEFLGDCKFITNDRYAIVVDNSPIYPGRVMVAFANGAGLTSYTIADGTEAIDNYTFVNAEELTQVTFPSTIRDIWSATFIKTELESIYGVNVESDNRSLVVDNKLIYVAPKNLKEYTTSENVTKLAEGVFIDKSELESVTISDNVTAVDASGHLFNGTKKLTTITISARMKSLSFDPFDRFNDVVESVYMRAPTPPSISHDAADLIVNGFSKLTIYVPDVYIDNYLTSPDWQPYKNYIKPYDYGDLSEFIDYDDSTDYSKDGEVLTLQTATEGDGIDLVIVGDGFIDTDMEDGGVYETRMKEAMEHFFSEEPYTTFRNRYNVYAVKAVSKNEGIKEGNNTAFSVKFGEGTQISGNDTKAFQYAEKIPSIETTQNLLIIVVINSSRYAGTCYMYTDDSAVAYCPITENDDELFRQLINHEAGGHGFGKLFDEYAYSGTIPQLAIDVFHEQKELGWGANVDIINDPKEIQWAHILADSHYKGLVGIFEGALTYEFGAYRPTDVSIMRYNTDGYNAPSREEIYRRIMTLSGDTFDYEKFVTYDAINRTKPSAAQAFSTFDRSKFVPLAPPVMIKSAPLVTK